jgi:hypothetical protein
MTSTSIPAPSRWPRYLPKQFSIGALLLLITVVAFFLWWYVQPPEGIITDDQANRITFGMSRDEVRKALGAPQNTRSGAWTYEIRDSSVYPDDKTIFVIVFNEKQVVTMYRAPERILVRPDDAK